MKPEIVAIGGSLGAVEAIGALCRALPREFAASVCVVLHVGSRGQNLLADNFDAKSYLTVRTARDGDLLAPGYVFVAPADHHLLVVGGALRLGRGPRENLARPAVDPLLRSVGACYGPRAIGVVLSGLLNDGAAGLADLKRCGGITVVQNPADAVAPSMPLGALNASEVDYRADIAAMPALLGELLGRDVGPAPAVPPDVQLEIEIALGLQSGSAAMTSLGMPVALSCPTCDGVLSRITRQTPLRYRCQVGHAFTADALASVQEGSVDEAMRLAMRVLEERAELNRQMAHEATRSGRPAAAAISARTAAHSHAAAEVLRRAVLTRAEDDDPE